MPTDSEFQPQLEIGHVLFIDIVGYSKLLIELSRHRSVHPYWRALLYLSLENREQAIRWLEQAIADHDGLNIMWIKVDPLLDPLHGDPRFESLVQKVVGPKQK